MKKAVILLSGGLDSSTVAAIAKAEGYTLYALSFMYGQRHHAELAAAARVAARVGVAEHRTLSLEALGALGGSALTDASIAVPKDRAQMEGIPLTYVPARNTLFLSYALAWAEVLGARDVFIGVNALDYSGYPDCRPDYIAAFERMANLATKAATEGQKLTLHAPLINKTKAEIIREGMARGVDYGLTLSCYDPTASNAACGHCDACHLRAKGFLEAGFPDPATIPDRPSPR